MASVVTAMLKTLYRVQLNYQSNYADFILCPSVHLLVSKDYQQMAFISQKQDHWVIE